MYATLQAAFGTWPSDRSFAIEPANDDVRASGVNETFNFESENPSESAGPVFVLNPDKYPNGKVFIPPFFVPPDIAQNGTCHATSYIHHSASSPHTSSRRVSQSQNINVNIHEEVGASSSDPAQDPGLDDSGPLKAPVGHVPQIQTESARQPSPEPSAATEAERAELWSSESRKAFHEMVTAPGYINRYRLHMKKRERMMQYLQNPDREPLLCDGSRDHQTKYQAAHWTVMNGKLYRKPESGRVARYRRHLDDFEAWDVLTLEHLRSGHLGRDKLRKVLEQNYIGYTLQEIMFVLKECKKCAGRGPNAERKDLNHDFEIDDAREMGNAAEASAAPRTSNPPDVITSASKGPYNRPQTSNFMWF
jgi:hypothetical protein